MSDFSDSMEAVVNELLPEFGLLVTISRNFAGTYDPTSGNVINSAFKTFQGYAVRYDYNAFERNNNLILENDTRYIISPTTEGDMPMVGDTTNIKGIDYRIVRVISYQASDADIAYECQVRV